MLGLGILPNNQRTWFELASPEPEILSLIDTPMIFSAAFTLHNDVLHHNRSIYNSLDLLGDVGGLFDALRGIGSFLIAIYFRVFGNPIHSYLLRKLFIQNPKRVSDIDV